MGFVAFVINRSRICERSDHGLGSRLITKTAKNYFRSPKFFFRINFFIIFLPIFLIKKFNKYIQSGGSQCVIPPFSKTVFIWNWQKVAEILLKWTKKLLRPKWGFNLSKIRVKKFKYFLKFSKPPISFKFSEFHFGQK